MSSKVNKRMGRPLLGDVPMLVLGVRLEPHDSAALAAYAIVKGHKSRGAAARALILEGLDRLRAEHERTSGDFGADRSYFTK